MGARTRGKRANSGRRFHWTERLEDRRLLATFAVTSTADAGEGSLRWAIEQANATAGADTISFNIAPGGIQRITPATALPELADTVTIDGTTQPGYAGSPIVELMGPNIASLQVAWPGLSVQSPGCMVRGLAIGAFGDQVLLGSTDAVVAGNWLGLDASGAKAGVSESGVHIRNIRNRIGGITAADRNVISGNGWGVLSDFTPTTSGLSIDDINAIEGNYIGTNPDGTGPVPNEQGGVCGMLNGYTWVGTYRANSGNLIAFNGGPGVSFPEDPYTYSGSAVQFNTIHSNAGAGLDARYTSVYISQNSIYSNGGLGIDLDDAGMPNGYSLRGGAPVITAVVGNSVRGYLPGGTQGCDIWVELFFSPEMDPSGFGEGREYLGKFSGNWDDPAEFAINLPSQYLGRVGYLTATANYAAAYTEFSQAFPLNQVDHLQPVASITSGYGENNDAAPPSAGPFVFNIWLSENVVGFDASDIVLEGTAQPTTVSLVRDETGLWKATVEGCQQAGSVTISIPAGVFTDLSGNSNLPSSLAPAKQFQFVPNHQGTFVVTSTADAGEGSLRWAIEQANATAGADTISFNIAPGGIQRITPATALPELADTVTIDGTTQPGYAGSPLVELIGASDVDGLVTLANGCVIRGLAIAGFKSNIVLRSYASTVAGNWIGLDASGQPVNTQSTGVWIVGLDSGRAADVNHIGTSAEADRNLISGNHHGVLIDPAVNRSVDVVGNTIRANTGAGVRGGYPKWVLGNSFGDNGGLAIDWFDEGVTYNFPWHDAHSVVLASVENGMLNAYVPDRRGDDSFTVELYFTPEPDPTLYGEGTQLVATYSQSEYDSRYQFQIALPLDLTSPGYLTATCTAAGYTSEFSRVLPLNLPDQVPPAAAVMPANGTLLRTTEPKLTFKVVLSEPAIGFGPEDLVVGGSAGASILSVTESMAVYSVVVGDFQQPGTITLSIPAGSFTDAAGNPNPAAALADSNIPQFIYNSPPVAHVLEPSGPVRGIAEIPFVLRDAESDACTIWSSYSLDGGKVWRSDQMPVLDVASSPEGTQHVYFLTTVYMNGGKDGPVLFRLKVNDGVRYDYFPSEPVTLIVDNHPPTATISPAPGEVRSSTASSVWFNVNFSEAVTGFDASDVVLEGTAGASAAVVSGSGKAYAVSVSGMVRAGTVSIRIPAGAVVDQAGTAMSTTATSGSYTVPAQWLPYQPAPAQAELTIDTTSTTRCTVTLSFPDAGYRVTSWDPPIRIGDVFGVNVNVERWTGDSAQVLTTSSHVYDLGTLTPGRYTLALSAWGVPVESQPFVVRPTFPNPPGTPWALPGRIEAENFDTGGESVAYHDADVANLGSKYRSDVGVDIEGTTGAYSIGYVKAGEWLEYTVNLASAGTYNLATRLANTAAGGRFHLELDGAPITGSIAVPSTGGWQTWQTLVTYGLNLPVAGPHVLRICFDTNASNGFVGNFDWIQFTAVAPPVAPTGVAASDGTFADKIRVAWNASTDATGYDVYRSTLNDYTTASLLGSSATTSYDDTTAIAGTPYYYWVKAKNAAGASGHSSSDVGTRAIGPTQTPYLGLPFAVGATIQAEDFDNGGQGVAYHDVDAANLGGKYRTTEGVDIESVAGATGKYNVGWTKAGEWLEYTVNLPSAGTYTLQTTWASPASGGVFHIEFDGVNKTGSLAVPKTGGWQTWQTISTTVNLSAGTQVMRVAFDTNGTNGFVGNLEWLKLSSTVTPITIQVEDFVSGGEGVGYHDVDTANLGGKYRTGEGVDIATTTDTGGGYNVGYIKAGEWLKYTTTVATAGTYNLDFRVASAGTGGTFHLEVDGVNVTGTLAVPNTGGWQTWQTISKSGISLSAGAHTLRLVFDSNGSSGFVGNINWLQIRG